MPLDYLLLVAMLLLGIIAKNSLVAAGAAFLLLIKLTDLEALLPFLEQKALDFGLILLLVSLMTPLAMGKIEPRDLLKTIGSLPGLMAVGGGILAAHLSAQGVTLMQEKPELLIGLVLGAVLGVAFFKGIPVGPLAAAGFTALFLSIFKMIVR